MMINSGGDDADRCRKLVASIVDQLRERPEMFCGSLTCLESYLLGMDQIVKQLCGASIYRQFLFEQNFGTHTFMSRFQSKHECTVVLANNDTSGEGTSQILENEFAKAISSHLKDFATYLSSN